MARLRFVSWTASCFPKANNRFATAYFQLLPIEALKQFSEADCLRTALRLKLPLKLARHTPIPKTNEGRLVHKSIIPDDRHACIKEAPPAELPPDQLQTGILGRKNATNKARERSAICANAETMQSRRAKAARVQGWPHVTSERFHTSHGKTIELSSAHMIFTRQRLLLALLDALGGSAAGTDFQKLLFLYTQEWESEPSYDFVPYQFGSFSFTSYADKRRLIERGLLDDDEKRWGLTEAGRLVAQQERTLRERTGRFASGQTHLRGDALIAAVYRRHPYYATRSRIVERVLPEARERAAIDDARPVARGPGLVTIGYEGRSLESYLNALLKDSVTLLCDVRRNPLSRKYGFSKSTLSKACEHVGLRYEHLPKLGIASDDRQALKTQADYDSLFAQYERDHLPQQTASLTRIREWIEQAGQRVALTCFEAAPCQCHRHCVANALAQGGGNLLTPHHL